MRTECAFVQSMNRGSLRRHYFFEATSTEILMTGVLQWIGFALGISLLALGLKGFFSGLALPPNTPEHRAHGKGDNWRIDA